MEIVVGIVVATALVVVAWLVWHWVGRGTAQARAALAEIAAGRKARRQSGAQSYGIRSKGALQLRGFGYLALFDDELVFVQALAGNHVRAQLVDIVSVTTPRSFLGKSSGRKLLAVEWRTDANTEAVAFVVPDLKAWLEDLSLVGVRIGEAQS